MGNNKQNLSCFVMMPFCDTKFTNKKEQEIIITKKDWEDFFEKWIKRAVESFDADIECKRSPTIPGNFVKGIVGDLNRADFTIADLTVHRPNILYELGIRHSLKNGNIIITQSLESIPSDLGSYYRFEYEYSKNSIDSESDYKNFERNIHIQIQSIVDNNFPADNPISDYLGKGIREEANTHGFISEFTSSEFRQLLANQRADHEGLLIGLKEYKELFSHVFRNASSLVEFLNSEKPNSEKIEQINKFLKKLENTFHDPILVKRYSKNRKYQVKFTRAYIVVREYLKSVRKELDEE